MSRALFPDRPIGCGCTAKSKRRFRWLPRPASCCAHSATRIVGDAARERRCRGLGAGVTSCAFRTNGFAGAWWRGNKYTDAIIVPGGVSENDSAHAAEREWRRATNGSWRLQTGALRRMRGRRTRLEAAGTRRVVDFASFSNCRRTKLSTSSSEVA